MNEIFFISGLPRSGSTLLCNILAQNNKIHTTPTSACHDAIFLMRNGWNEWIEHKASKELSNENNLKRILKAILYNYHNTDRDIIIDKGRAWLSLIELTEFILDKKIKILVPVRNINQILSSFEKLYRKEMYKRNLSGDYFLNQTTEGRIKKLLEGTEPVGLAYNRLKDAIQRGFADRLFLVEFEDLTNDPELTMKQIYNFLELDYFKHTFNNIEQYTHEDDGVYGLDLHNIRKDVKPVKDDSIQILGNELNKKYIGFEFWREIN